MKEKLCAYVRSQLPGGKYYDPEDNNTKQILSTLKPNNDICESILGLNDYFTTALPKMKQLTRSNMIAIQKIKQWSGLMT